MTRHLKDRLYEELARIGKALGSPKRLELLEVLAQGERSVEALSLGEMKNFVARRPVHTVLATEKYERLTGTAPRDWREAVEHYVRDHYRT